MPRSHILARELRGIVVVGLVLMLILWLFGRLSDDRAEAQSRVDLVTTTTAPPETSTTTSTVVVDDVQRLCSLSLSFRQDLSEIRINLVDRAGNPLTEPGDLPYDIGMHRDGDIPVEVREARTVASAAAIASGASIPEPPEEFTTTTTIAPPTARATPRITNTERVDPLESGLLGTPQEIALNFYAAASTLRLGLVDADFEASAEHFVDLVNIGSPLLWDLEEIAESDLADRWQALATRPNDSIGETLDFIEESCSIRIGSGFFYREVAPDLPILQEIFIDGDVDPSVLEPLQAPPTTTAG